jgi:hypothetical protein
MKAFNAKTQELEDVVFSLDLNNDIICTFEDGHFIKFPAGSTKDEILDLLALHEAQNEGQSVITPEMEEAQAEQKAQAEEVIDELNS